MGRNMNQMCSAHHKIATTLVKKKLQFIFELIRPQKHRIPFLVSSMKQIVLSVRDFSATNLAQSLQMYIK